MFGAWFGVLLFKKASKYIKMNYSSQDRIFALFILIFDFNHQVVFLFSYSSCWSEPISSARQRIWASHVKSTLCNCSKMSKNSSIGSSFAVICILRSTGLLGLQYLLNLSSRCFNLIQEMCNKLVCWMLLSKADRPDSWYAFYISDCIYNWQQTKIQKHNLNLKNIILN